MSPRSTQPPQGERIWAAEPGPEDGADPRAFHEKPWNQPRQAGRKARQLCEQVAEALRAILAGMSDEVLQNLVIVSVEPAPHTGRLLVTVAVPHSADVIGLTLAQTHLARATARIRLEVTQEIHRRKSPELVWFIMP